MNLNANKIKIPTKEIAKETLLELYIDKKMSMDEIGKFFGYRDRQPIMRLFKKFGIKSKTISEATKDKNYDKYKFPSVSEFKELLKHHSVLRLSKKMNIPRRTIIKYMKENDISNNYFVNTHIKEQLNNPEYENLSPKELANLFNVEISIIKQYKKKFTEKLYSIDELKNIFEKYNYDFDNQGLSKQIRYDDENVFNSIMCLTDDHKLQSKKLTERIYRLFNNYSPEQENICKFCGVKLKFYTYQKGYGFTDNRICKKCIPNFCGFGVSKISQDLFMNIYNHLNEQKRNKCKFHELNGEMIMPITPNDHFALKDISEHLNQYNYHVDFVCENKIIEFDGSYWHKNGIKDSSQTKFFEYKGYQVLRIPELEYYNNREKVIQQCITFLNQ